MKTLLLLLCSALALAVTASAKVTEKFAQTYPLDANGSIHLENVNGSVEIVAWDKAEVSLEAEKKAKSGEGLKRMQIKIESAPDRLVIKTIHEKQWKFWDNMNAQVRYKLMVPANARLEKIDVVNASITVRGVQGFVDLETVNGSIDAEGLAHGGSFDSVNGSISASFSRLAAGDEIDLDTVNGSCAITLPKDAAFDLSSETVNGRIACDFPITLSKSGKRELRGSINGGGAKVHLESVNGGLQVRAAK